MMVPILILIRNLQNVLPTLTLSANINSCEVGIKLQVRQVRCIQDSSLDRDTGQNLSNLQTEPGERIVRKFRFGKKFPEKCEFISIKLT